MKVILKEQEEIQEKIKESMIECAIKELLILGIFTMEDNLDKIKTSTN